MRRYFFNQLFSRPHQDASGGEWVGFVASKVSSFRLFFYFKLFGYFLNQLFSKPHQDASGGEWILSAVSNVGSVCRLLFAEFLKHLRGGITGPAFSLWVYKSNFCQLWPGFKARGSTLVPPESQTDLYLFPANLRWCFLTYGLAVSLPLLAYGLCWSALIHFALITLIMPLVPFYFFRVPVLRDFWHRSEADWKRMAAPGREARKRKWEIDGTREEDVYRFYCNPGLRHLPALGYGGYKREHFLFTLFPISLFIPRPVGMDNNDMTVQLLCFAEVDYLTAQVDGKAQSKALGLGRLSWLYCSPVWITLAVLLSTFSLATFHVPTKELLFGGKITHLIIPVTLYHVCTFAFWWLERFRFENTRNKYSKVIRGGAANMGYSPENIKKYEEIVLESFSPLSMGVYTFTTGFSGTIFLAAISLWLQH